MGNAAVQRLIERRGFFDDDDVTRSPVPLDTTTDDVKPDDQTLPQGGTTTPTTWGSTFTVSNATENRDEESLNDVATALSNKTEAGSTLPTMGDIKTDLDGNSKVLKAAVTVTETVTLPKWTKYDKQCDRHKAEWDRFSAALKTHEDSHVAIDRKWFENITSKLIGLKDSDVDAKLAAIQAQAQKDNEDYDTANGHGTKNGTNIDAGIRCSDKVE